ncbi:MULTISPECIES: hypothetical protein [Streptomyces]|uniref:Uncharacterized protein n=2 Tax=Streptomyces TaxID=1883 RepID=A0AAV4KSK7_9ACTN|nr:MULTISPECIES: hypothetical protein [Streptomyces]AVH96738.1 hypothetical protein C5L38_18090 [Streptomyces sp. WAC00288]PVC66489.1 hypothetical protein DBP18_28100 [Streptomyces sp. CS081A]QEV33512.1 hypothetical protein CP977_16155 [Streptomyces cinereoruber]GGR45070.1 hypothetical protein GCM10010497_55630 [Streptomyces cinereoruber]
MGWTHDYGDTTARDRGSAAGPGPLERGGPPEPGRTHAVQGVGISRILRRRARWVSARLRHTRG